MSGITGFTICAIVIFFAGKKLAYYGDAIAELTGFGKAWIGLILMASVTSLPELAVGISSSAIVKSPDLAVGDILGSCAFNLCILAMLDMFVKDHKGIFSVASQSHTLAIAIGIILISVVGYGLFLPRELVVMPWLGATSLLCFIGYLFSIRLIYNFELKNPKIASPGDHQKPVITLGAAAARYAFFAIVTVAAALFLPHFADLIANETGLGKGFVGTLFLAASTSLPEIAVSIAAVRMGSIDLSVGNLAGSNIFNIVILAIDDVFYTGGHLLKDASDSHMLSVLATIITSAIAIAGLTYRPNSKKFLLGWDAILILVIYTINLVLLYSS
jgi:cation:H+ antiporter